MRAWLGVLLVGCSSFQPMPPDDIAEFPDARPDTTLPPEASTFDVADETKFNGGGEFLCDNDCICDGTSNYCLVMWGGLGSKAPIVDAGADDADADADTSDGGPTTCDPEASACTQIPIACLPKPTCDCLVKQHPSCTCTVDPSGNGLVITCELPP